MKNAEDRSVTFSNGRREIDEIPITWKQKKKSVKLKIKLLNPNVIYIKFWKEQWNSQCQLQCEDDKSDEMHPIVYKGQSENDHHHSLVLMMKHNPHVENKQVGNKISWIFY